MQLGVVTVVSVEKGARGETGVLMRKGAGPATLCLQYPPNTLFRKVRNLSEFIIPLPQSLLSECAGPATLCLQYPPNAPFCRV